MDVVSMFCAIMAGVFTTLEAAINARLGKHVTPSIATLHSLATGMVFILLISLVRGSIIRYSKVIHVSPIWLIGGIFGALIIYLSSKAIPVLGVSRALIFILAAQLVSGYLVDIFLNGVEVNLRKAMGLIIFLAGAYIFIRE
jgi:transporter family-2 protein